MRLIKIPVFIGLFVSSGCYALETGNLTVIFSDTDGKPITNATVKVKTSKGAFWGRGSESEYFHYEGHSDSNGVASIDFGFRDADFSWRVITPSHYSQEFGSKRECFDSVVEESDYLHVDTNTVEGLARYEELRRLYYADDAESYVQYISKMQPKNVTYTNKRIVRSVRFYPKRNPQPMFKYGRGSRNQLPENVVNVVTHDNMQVDQYSSVDFDMMKRGFLRPWGNVVGCIGSVSDFKIVRFHTNTNNVDTYFGWMEFADGCGACKMHKTGDESFPTTYTADTNAIYLSRIPFEYHNVDGKYIYTKELLKDDEYMVLRTRAVFDDSGAVTNCHYALIGGRMRICGNLFYRWAVFNPRPNDPNLEYDFNNLARPKSR